MAFSDWDVVNDGITPDLALSVPVFSSSGNSIAFFRQRSEMVVPDDFSSVQSNNPYQTLSPIPSLNIRNGSGLGLPPQSLVVPDNPEFASTYPNALLQGPWGGYEWTSIGSGLFGPGAEIGEWQPGIFDDQIDPYAPDWGWYGPLHRHSAYSAARNGVVVHVAEGWHFPEGPGQVVNYLVLVNPNTQSLQWVQDTGDMLAEDYLGTQWSSPIFSTPTPFCVTPDGAIWYVAHDRSWQVGPSPWTPVSTQLVRIAFNGSESRFSFTNYELRSPLVPTPNNTCLVRNQSQDVMEWSAGGGYEINNSIGADTLTLAGWYTTHSPDLAWYFTFNALTGQWFVVGSVGSEIEIPPLRQAQRDDAFNAPRMVGGSQPSSFQYSTRRGGAVYL